MNLRALIVEVVRVLQQKGRPESCETSMANPHFSGHPLDIKKVLTAAAGVV